MRVRGFMMMAQAFKARIRTPVSPSFLTFTGWRRRSPQPASYINISLHASSIILPTLLHPDIGPVQVHSLRHPAISHNEAGQTRSQKVLRHDVKQEIPPGKKRIYVDSFPRFPLYTSAPHPPVRLVPANGMRKHITGQRSGLANFHHPRQKETYPCQHHARRVPLFH